MAERSRDGPERNDMADEDIIVKGVRQIIPSSALCLRVEGLKPDEALAEFVPVVAIALLEVERPHDRFFTDYAYMPLTPNDLMYGWVERFPYEGLRVRFSLFHEVDFEDIGVRLKPSAKPRSWHVTAKGSVMERARDLQQAELEGKPRPSPPKSSDDLLPR